MIQRKHDKEKNNPPQHQFNLPDNEKEIELRRIKAHTFLLIGCSVMICMAYLHHVAFVFRPIRKNDTMVKPSDTSVYPGRSSTISVKLKKSLNDQKSSNVKVTSKKKPDMRKKLQMNMLNLNMQGNLDKQVDITTGYDIREHLRNNLLMAKERKGMKINRENTDVKIIKHARSKAHSEMEIEIDRILEKQTQQKSKYVLDAIFRFLSWKYPFQSKDATLSVLIDTTIEEYERAGVIVLGMHRSGTSMFTGVLKMGLGYYTGGPLMGAQKKDNAKGYFERIDIVNQNDEFFTKQSLNWNNNVVLYNDRKALQQIKDKQVKFMHGRNGLKFLNSVYSSPWIQKDPRMCITLPTWLALMESEPAIVFTYRHPLEVAESLSRRSKMLFEEIKGFSRSLWLWIIYNQKAIQNSNSLCRVITSQEAILSNPITEINRVVDELTTKCGVIAPKKKLSSKTIDEFIDEKLHHNKHQNETILTIYGTNCTLYKYTSQLKPGTQQAWREMELYLIAMEIYCDLKSGAAFREDYVWPSLYSKRRRNTYK